MTQTILLRKLTYKSILKFGKYAELSIQEIINLGKKNYLRWIYFNSSMISFTDIILTELSINKEYIINKPGKDPELGKKLNNRISRFTAYIKIKEKNSSKYYHNKRAKKADYINRKIADEFSFSKGILQRINQ